MCIFYHYLCLKTDTGSCPAGPRTYRGERAKTQVCTRVSINTPRYPGCCTPFIPARFGEVVIRINMLRQAHAQFPL